MSNRIEEAKKRVAELQNKNETYTSSRIEEARKRVESLTTPKTSTTKNTLTEDAKKYLDNKMNLVNMPQKPETLKVKSPEEIKLETEKKNIQGKAWDNALKELGYTQEEIRGNADKISEVYKQQNVELAKLDYDPKKYDYNIIKANVAGQNAMTDIISNKTSKMTFEEYEDYINSEYKKLDKYEKYKSQAYKNGNWEAVGQYEILIQNAKFAEELNDMKNKYDDSTFFANYNLGQMQIDYGMAMNRYFTTDNEQDFLKAEQIRKKMEYYTQRAENAGKGGWITKDIATHLPQEVGQIRYGLAGALGGAYAGGLAGSVIPGAGTVAGAVKGAGAGSVAGVATFSYNLMRGLAYSELLELGVPTEIAKAVAKDTALWQSAIEAVGAASDLFTLGAGKLLTGATKNAAKITLRKMIFKAVGAYGWNLVTETAEEATQEIVAIKQEEKALEMAGIEDTRTDTEKRARVIEAAEGGFKVAAFLGSGNAIGNITVSTINNATLKQTDAFYDDYIEEVKNSDLNETDKNALIKDAEEGREIAKAAIQEAIETNKPITNTQVAEKVQKAPEIVENLPENEKISQKSIQNVSNLQKTGQKDTSVVEQKVADLISNNDDVYDEDVADIVNNILEEEFKNADLDDDNVYDAYDQRTQQLYKEVEQVLTNQGYEKPNYYAGRGDPSYIPSQKRLDGAISDLNIEYGKRPSNTLEVAQLDKIRENIDDIISEIETPENISISKTESKSSLDATYIDVYDETTDEVKIIRVANHYKEGVSGKADYNIYIDEYKSMDELNKAIEATIREAVGNDMISKAKDDVKKQFDKNVENKYTETGGEKDGKNKSNVDFTRNGLAVDSGVQKNKLLTKEEEYRRKYEQLIADNKTEITPNQLQSKKIDIIKEKLGINTHIVKENNIFGGAANQNNIFITEEAIEKFGFNFMLGHEGFEAIILQAPSLREEYINPLIETIIKFETNIDEIINLYVDEAELEYKEILMKNPKYIIKEIIMDEGGYLMNEDAFGLGIDTEKLPNSIRYGSKLSQIYQDAIKKNLTEVINGYKKNIPSRVLEESSNDGSFSLPKIPKNHIRLYRGLENKYDSNYDKTKLDNVNGYESWTDSYELARQYGNNVYYIDVPLNEVGTEVMNEDGDRFLVYKNNKPAGLNNVTGDEYMLYTDHEKFRDVKYNEVFQNNTPLKVDLPKTDNQGRELTAEQQEVHKDNQLKDENGNIIRLYHGTKNDFTTFSPSKGGEFGPGIYLAEREETARWYAKYVARGENTPKVMEVYAVMKNPYTITKMDYIKATERVTPKTFMNRLIKQGYDGIIGIELNGYDKQYIVFEPNQVKSVDNANPTSDPDIRLSRREGNQDSYKTNAERMSALIEQKINDIESGKVKREEGLGTISRKEIRQKIEKYLGRSIRTGGFRQRAYAIYKPAIQSIRTKQLTDIDSIIHELGHHVDLAQLNVTPTKDVLNWKKQYKELAMEMNNLCEIAFGNVYDRTPRTKLEEGFAEFTRRYIIDTENAINKYPYLADLITEARENNQELDKIFTDLINDVKTYINMKPEERIISNVSINEDEKKDFTIGKVVDRLMYEIYDDNWYLKKAANTLAKNAGKGNIYKLKPSENPYILFRLANSGSDQTTNMLNKGIRDWDTNEKITEGFASILEPITNAEEMMKLRMLLIAQRNKDYVKKGQQTGLREKDAITTVNLLEQDKKIKKTAEAFRKENDGILEYARREGLMTSKQINDIKKLNENYVAMNRVMDNEGKIISPSTKGAKVGKTVYQTTGSDREIIDPIESTIMNSARIIRQVENNKVLKSLVKLGQASNQYADLFEIVPPPMEYRGSVELSKFEKALEKQGVDTTELDMEEVYNIFNMKLADDRNKIMSYIDNGKRVYVQFYDEDLYNVLKGMNGQNMSLVEKFLNWANTPLRYGATMANAEFAIPNAISDAQQAFLYSDATFIPVIDNILGIINTLAGRDKTFSKILNNIVPSYVETQKEFYNLYQQSGASQSGRFSTYREKIRDNATDIYGKKKKILFGKFDSKTGIYKSSSSKYKAITNLLSNVVNKALDVKTYANVVNKALDVMTYASELTEESTRFQNFRKETKLYRKKGLSNRDMRLKAAINAKDITQDFGRTGKSTRSINKVIPFSAARVGSVYRFGEAIHAHPFKTSLKLGILIAFTLAIKAYTDSKENKHVEEMADQKKKDNFVIAFDETSEPMTIKKVQGTARSIINLAEYLYDLSNDKIPEGKETEKLAEWAKDTMFDMLPADDLGNMTPQIIKPLLENWLNKDFYYKTDLIPQNLQGLKPEDQYDEYTSEFAILLGKALNVSPIYIDNIFEGYFAGVGTQILDGLDMVLDVTDKGEQATKNKSEQFILKRFFASGYRSGASIDEVYDLSAELEIKKDYGEATDKELEQLKKLSQAKKTMSQLNKQIKQTRSSLILNSDEKQKEIQKLQELRTDTARYYLDKELINSSNKNTIELYEYYPANSEYVYKPKTGIKVTVTYTEADKQEYAKLAKEYYEKEIKELKKQEKYKEASIEEKEKQEESVLTKARNYAKEQVSKKVYERDR